MAIPHPGLIITATDTGVGKTVVTSTLTRALRRGGVAAVACKPVETGCGWEDGVLHPADGAALRAAADNALTLDDVCPVRFAVAAAPLRAAREIGAVVDVAAMTAAVARLRAAHPFTVVEGIGGVAVPLTADATLLDWFATLRLPALVVTTPRLGTLNHTWLTVHALRAAAIPVIGLAINWVAAVENDPAVTHAVDDLTELTGLPVLGRLPEVGEPVADADWQRLAACLDWRAILRAVQIVVDPTP
jgi:dethiobiotin synthetase